MTEAQRHQILLDLLAQTGFVTVEQVISRLGISPATARRDINKLDENGKLKKVRNGAEGGQYNHSHFITLSPQGSENSLYAGHWMFTSGKGLTAEGLYKTDMLTAMAEQKMLNVVGKLAVLVDSSKVGERAGMLFSQASQIDLVITGKQADETILKQLEDQGVQVIRV